MRVGTMRLLPERCLMFESRIMMLVLEGTRGSFYQQCGMEVGFRYIYVYSEGY